MKFILIIFLICAPGSVFAAAAAASSAAIVDEYRAIEERHKVQCLEYAGEIARNEDEFLRRALAVNNLPDLSYNSLLSGLIIPVHLA